MEKVLVNLHGKEYEWPKSDLGWFEHFVSEGHLERTKNGYWWTDYNFRCVMINVKKLGYLADNRWFLYYVTALRIKFNLF